MSMVPLTMLAQVVGDGPITFPATFDTDLIMWSALLATVMPAIIAVVIRTGWASEQKGIATIALCLVAATGTAFLLGKLDPTNWVTSALIIFVLTNQLYRQFYKPTDIAESIERATG